MVEHLASLGEALQSSFAVSHVQDEGVVAGSAFGFEDAGHCIIVRGDRSEPVYCLGGESDRQAAPGGGHEGERVPLYGADPWSLGGKGCGKGCVPQGVSSEPEIGR